MALNLLSVLPSGDIFAQLKDDAIKEVFTDSNGKAYTAYIVQTGVVLFVAGLNLIYEKYWFRCPRSYSTTFSLFAIFAPMIPLYLLAVFTNVELRRAIQDSCHSFRVPSKRIKWRKLLKNMFFNYIACFIAPATWIIMTLFKKDMYVCAIVGYVNVTDPEMMRRKDRAEALSGVFGLISLAILSFILIIMLVIKTCCIPECRNENLTSLETFTSLEAELARKYFEEALKNITEQNAIKKVNIILGCESELTTEEIEKMSFEKILKARERLLEVYPRLKNPDDENLNWFCADQWKKEADQLEKIIDSCDESETTTFMAKEIEGKNREQLTDDLMLTSISPKDKVMNV